MPNKYKTYFYIKVHVPALNNEFIIVKILEQVPDKIALECVFLNK